MNTCSTWVNRAKLMTKQGRNVGMLRQLIECLWIFGIMGEEKANRFLQGKTKDRGLHRASVNR